MSDDPRQNGPVVTDPDDYNRQQRFKEIHEARQRVSDYMANFERRLIESDNTHQSGTAPTYAHEQLAYRVALYVMELQPLLNKAEGEDAYLSEEFSDDSPVRDLQHFARNSGMVRDGSSGKAAVRITTSLRVYQVANKAYADLGMDLEVAEEQGDVGFEYADILEEGPPGDQDGSVESVEENEMDGER